MKIATKNKSDFQYHTNKENLLLKFFRASKKNSENNFERLKISV